MNMSLSTEAERVQTYRDNRYLHLYHILQTKLNNVDFMAENCKKLVDKLETMKQHLISRNDNEDATYMGGFISYLQQNIWKVKNNLVNSNNSFGANCDGPRRIEVESYIINWPIDYINEVLTLFENPVENNNRTAIENIQAQLAEIVAQQNAQSLEIQNMREQLQDLVSRKG